MEKQEILKKYNISDATLRNWKKLNYIKDINDIDPSEIDNILKKKTGVRRNKRTSDDNIIPQSYINDKKIINIIQQILELKSKYNISINEVLHETIIKIIAKNKLITPDEISTILGNRTENTDFISEFEKIDISYEEDNDFLGCLYMSLLSIGNKDTNGIYYTPFKVVDKIIKSVDFKKNKKIVDPGCGSGNFLIQAFKEMKRKNITTNEIIENLYGFDIDPIAGLLAKVNIYILDQDVNFNKINICNIDFLNDDCNINFDAIIGNPPWGKKYTAEEKKILKKKYNSDFAKLDSFSQFIIRSFELLNEKGSLSFVLPSSILNIAVHESIRSFLLENNIKYIKKIGREFEEIVTDVILIQVEKDHADNNICEYDDIKINQSYFKNNAYSNFLVSDNTASSIIDKLKNTKHFHLVEDVNYALGVVTGDNKTYLSSEKNDNNEPIISGKELSKYKFNYDTIKNYIIFDKDKLQQVAKEEYYRCKNKIIYKFIGKKLCFAVENKGYLTLNSANVICIDNNKNINYISSILNSRITQLYFDESYDTHKVLKNHIQAFYIPDLNNDTIDKISKIVDKMNYSDSYNEEIEDIIYKELNLSVDEIEYLKNRYK